jgi:hypothetical protein
MFVVLTADLLLNWNLVDKLKKSIEKNWKIDFNDILVSILNEVYEWERLFSKTEVKWFWRWTLMELFSNVDLPKLQAITDKFPLLWIYDISQKNFVYPIDVRMALEKSQESNRIWDEDLLSKTIDILDKWLKNKSEYVCESNERLSKIQKSKLTEYLKDHEVYEDNWIITFEWDWVDEFLVMGAFPQPSCQNLLTQTWYNHKLLTHVLNPYTKLLLSFRKPEWFVEINFDNKTVVIEKDWVRSEESLQIEWRNVVVLWDSDDWVRLQWDYGCNVCDEGKVLEKMVKKYWQTGKIVADNFKIDKDEYWDDWFYEEGN